MIKDNFETYGQLVYDAYRDNVHSVEFLGRLKNDVGVEIEHFFKNAEKADLVRWFNHQIDEAIEFYRTTGFEPHVNIDLSVFDEITRLEAWEREAEDVKFTLEVTQVQGVPDLEIISQLKDPKNFPTKWPWKGITLALDDYDMNNMKQIEILKDYKFDIIKIDKSLVSKAESDYKIYKHLLDMKKNFNSNFIVEGVETAAQYRMLTDMGFHLFQGYFFHKPERLEDIISAYKSYNI